MSADLESARITITRVQTPDGEEHLFACREVHYDDAGKVKGWTDPIEFVGDTPGEVADSLARAAGSLASGVLDIDTRETLRLTLDGAEVRR